MRISEAAVFAYLYGKEGGELVDVQLEKVGHNRLVTS